jgi:hypothetical protein
VGGEPVDFILGDDAAGERLQVDLSDEHGSPGHNPLSRTVMVSRLTRQVSPEAGMHRIHSQDCLRRPKKERRSGQRAQTQEAARKEIRRPDSLCCGGESVCGSGNANQERSPASLWETGPGRLFVAETPRIGMNR